MPAPIPLTLTDQEKHELEQTRKHSSSRRVWMRSTALLRLGAGEAVAKVAEFLSVCPETITRWKYRWISSRTQGLADRPRTGRPSRATEEYLRLLEEALDQDPHAYGYDFSVWSAPRLGTHLFEKTGIRIGPDQLRRLIHRKKFAFRRPKHTLSSRQDPHEVEAAKQQLEALKKGP